MIKIIYLVYFKLSLYILIGLIYMIQKDEAIKKSGLKNKGLSTSAKIMAVLLWPLWLISNIVYNLLKYINK